MTNEELNSIANQWFSGFNKRDLEALLALYHEDAVHFSPKLKVRHPETRGLIRGKDELRRWWQDAFDRLPTLTYEIVRLTPFQDRVFMEYIRHVVDEEDMYVGEMLEVRSNLISKSSVFHQ